jgi:hypothetical protein
MNGKGDKPRNCFSRQFKDNYESINWNTTSESKFSDTKDNNGTDKRNLQNLPDSERISSERGLDEQQ